MPTDDDIAEDRNEQARRLREDRQAHLNLITLFQRLGYDLKDSDDVNRLNENLRFAEKQRKRTEWLEASRLGWIVNLLLVASGAVITASITWFFNSRGKAG